ncbi:MAG: UDP-N-acetylmuramyl-tripeptide synthetase [Candidatus Magasanikbacteria bacterium GW2011_GWA2_37_8]|uniref:UDP-N-acetylmuramyl-tripeptide synthetase n=1 Tax=Candidatus Magasanikbacteria bacterium GW2011_GWA2_37_8 TaxID=1619036 RepID=A0A0G0JVH3_9BACT|nr:MAG: UDP-N-acetylmuramyl-tripeptide synthetase [Candidatus Magasanikbacteria bacterium GW2011_GWA2_37_8]
MKNLKHYLIALFAYYWYGRPARNLIVVGVTGTKGKSTTCRLIASILEAGGFKVGLLSTVEFQIGEKRWINDKKMTMLGLGQIQKMLREMVQAGCQYVVVETSSEGILQYRHFGLWYDVAVFTNLGTEHSERHGGFENLRQDKGKLFSALTKYPHKILNGKKIEKIIIANTDDENSKYFLNFQADKKIGYGLETTENLQINQTQKFVQGKIENSNESGSSFVVNNNHYKINIAGTFNVYNALAAVAVGETQNISAEKISVGLASVNKILGRMEFINAGQDFKVVVDYAHEPLSLTALFNTLRNIIGLDHKLITVIGSDGGGRDVKKRPKMGAIAGQLADYVVVTDVNCFDEDPKQIAEMLASGARESGKKDGQNLFIETDRRAAIKLAISLAKSGDVVAITAKGSEPCIVIANGQKIPWSDSAVAKEELELINN